MMKRPIACFLLALLWGAGPALAQNPPFDPLEQHIFPPEAVMQNQIALGISEDQRDYLLAQIQQVQQTFTTLQWKLQGEMEEMAHLLSGQSVDEEAALQHLQVMLDLEKEIKTAHMRLAIRIKNTLTAEQQQKLRQIRRQNPNRPNR